MNDFLTFVLYPILFSGITYWGISGIWLIFDLNVAPLYRISGGEVIDWKLYKKTAIHVFFIQMSTTPIVMYCLIPLWRYRGIDTSWSSELFSFYTLFKLILCPFIGDFIFYMTHRLCHLNLLYKKVHKKHHEWKVPVALAAAYTTMYEYVICNLSTFLLPPMILGINWYAANIWFIFSTISVVNDHSGYVFLKGSVRHTKHHKYTKYNYGSKYLDKLSNTEC
jgi:methylsterol monooxygenase